METVEDYERAREVLARSRGARIAAGLTQGELAKALGVSRSSISRWEAGAVRPRRATMLAYADVLAGMEGRAR